MNNLEAAWMFNEMADLLEIKGENHYKIRAYRKAARSIANWEESIENLREHGALQEIPGVGKNIADKLQEMITTGSCGLLERLRQEVPQGLLNITQLPGVGLRTARIIHQHLDIKDLGQLETAAKEKRIRKLPGLGPKTELNILRGMEMMRSQSDTSPLNLALASAEILVEFVSSLKSIRQVAIGGSIRRGKDMVGDIDLIATAEDRKFVLEAFKKHPHIKEVFNCENNRIEAVTWLGIKADLSLVEEEEFVPFLHRCTGSKAHFRKLAEAAAGRDCRLTGREVIAEGRKIPVKDEREIFSLLGLPYIPPELREDTGEIEAALAGRLPVLVDLPDIKGDLHLHSSWSDGINTIEELVQAALERGYSYLAITDHSKSLAIANGLTWERLQAQWKEIERLRIEYAPFKILKGLEVDILKDGGLDYDDTVLEQLDLVIASIHTGFKQEPEVLTERLTAAINNPYVDIVAHPTGRILGKRSPYSFDLDRVISIAAETGTILEINSSPDRLDLNAENARLAKEKGVTIAINTDAHDTARLEEMKFGVMTARRGWLEKQEVLNTYPPEQLMGFLRERREASLSGKGTTK